LTFGSKPLEEVPDPQHPLRVQPVDRLVQDDDAGITQQRRGNAQPLAHPQGEPADPLSRHVGQADNVDQLIDPAPAEAVGLGQRQQVVAGRPPGMHRLGLEQDAQLGHRGRGRTVIPAVDPDPAGGALIQAGDHPHRGRLTGPVRAEEAGHDAGLHDEVQPVDRQLLPVPLTEVLYLDHRVFLFSWSVMLSSRPGWPRARWMVSSP
jgi:hypothetical protein